MRNLRIQPVSMVNHEGMQWIDLFAHADRAMHLTLQCLAEGGGEEVLCGGRFALSAGENHAVLLLPAPEKDIPVIWRVLDERGEVIEEQRALWKKPRAWEFYIMISSHTDIGLHEPQYFQRWQTAKFLDEAMALCDQTADRAPEDQYRYVMEGTWMFDTYPGERGEEAARRMVRDYIQKGKLGVCTGVAGNHTQTFGLEEMCRAAYERRRLLDDWGIDCRTLTMIDNNGMSWAMVQPFAEAGYKRIIFAPNQWNPCPSTIWHKDGSVYGATWNPEASGGGARIDMRFDSDLPRIFYWQAADKKHKILVTSGGKYSQCGDMFGMQQHSVPNQETLLRMEARISRNLVRMEEKIPYDIWFMPIYEDNQEPEMNLTDSIAQWNAHWKWPRIQTAGNPDEAMDKLEERFGDQIPVLTGEMSGGWYQHPVSAPEVLAAKFAADRALPTAEKLSTLASLACPGYEYPATAFNRAWMALLCNDEHSYGVSGYQGRRVYETWMQHWDWVETAQRTADQESQRALGAVAARIPAKEPSLVVFNPMARPRTERICHEVSLWSEPVELPPMGYATVPLSALRREPIREEVQGFCPPVVENEFFRVAFAENGGIRSLVDKQLGRELIDQKAEYPANCLVYTQDNHQSFVTPSRASFTVCSNSRGVWVTARMEEPVSGAAIVQVVTLPAGEKRVDIDNRLSHVRGLYNNCRYSRYAYYAFPFDVPGGRRICHLNGCEAEYGVDNTGHCTDVYMACDGWACAENAGGGVALVQLDSELIEFDHIHPDKTDYGLPGEGSAMYVYLANDWLQMHTPGGSHMDFRFRYSIASYDGDHRAAGVPQLAERLATPVVTRCIPAQEGDLPARLSFMSAEARLLTLKRAEDGKGLIVRLYGDKPELTMNGEFFGRPEVAANTPDERETAEEPAPGFITLRLTGEGLCGLPVRAETETRGQGAARTPVGTIYTGLIQRPRAARGEEDGMLYLLWGAVVEKDLAGYEVYRGERSGFTADEHSRVAFAEPEEYCEGRYVDRGLKHHTRYFYRVCAVDKQGSRGPLSEEFSAWTKE